MATRSEARAKQLVLLACILGSAIVFLDGTVVSVALPSIQRHLGGGLAAEQWVTNAYLLTLGSLILIGGSLSDLFGERRIFALGAAGFGVTSLLCALAPTIDALIVARALQGVAGALLAPSALAVIVATFSVEERGKAIGTWTAWAGIATVLGPPLGGELIDIASWRWMFVINVPLVIVTVALIRTAIVPSRARGRRPSTRRGGRRPRGARARRSGVRAHRAAPPGLVEPRRVRAVDRRGGAARRLRGARGAHPRPDAAARAVRQSQLRHRQPRDAHAVRRPCPRHCSS